MTKVQTNSQGKVYVANGKALIASEGIAYNGLDSSFTNGEVTIKKGALADYSISEVTETGCLAKYQNIYNNYKIWGYPTINFGSGVVSGFSGGSTDHYIILPQNFPSTITQADMIFKGMLTDFSYHSMLLGCANSYERGFYVRRTTQAFSCYTGSWVDGTNALSTNTWYWFRVIFDGTNWIGYTLEDDDYVLDKLPDISQWRQEWTTTTNIISGFLFNIGFNYATPTEYWKGSINLGQSQIIINRELWWSAKGNSGIVKYNNTYIQTQGMLDTLSGTIPSSATSLYINYNPVGRSYMLDTLNSMKAVQVGNKWYSCPSGGQVNVTGFSSYPVYSISPSFGFSAPITYNTDDMSYSGFSSDNFIKGNYIFEMTTAQFTKGFTLQVHIKTPSSFPSDNMHLIYCGSDYSHGPYIGIRSGGKCAYCGLSSGGTLIFEISNTSTQLSANTEYWLRMTKPDTTYFSHNTVLQLSTDGETWTDLGSSSSAPSTTITADRWLRVGYGGKVFTGRLYLEDTFIEIDGTKVWDIVNRGSV